MKIENIPTPETYFQTTDSEETFKRGLEEVVNEIRSHLTKEELLCLSLYKNSKKQSNSIYKVFFSKYFNKDMTSAAITQRKKRLFKVLEAVGKLQRFKKSNAIDIKLRQILTKRQHQIMMLYEQRRTLIEIEDILGISNRGIRFRFKRAVDRLKKSGDPKIIEYLKKLNSVLKFSRKKQINLKSC